MREQVYVESVAARPPAFLLRRVSWGAISAGVIVTIVMQLMFTVLGVAVGASNIDPMQEQNPAQGLALSSAIWLLASGLVSLFMGTFIAGRLSGGPRRPDGMLHGIVTWSVSTLVTIFFLASATGFILGGLGTLVGSAIKTASGSGVMQQPEVQEQVRSSLPEAGALLPPTGNSPDAPSAPGSLTALAKDDPELAKALAQMEARGGANTAPEQRDQVVNLLTQKHQLDQQQASQLVGQWDQQFQQVKDKAGQKARETGQVAAEKTAQGAWWAFAALVLGMLVSAWGGWAGTASLPPRVEERVVTQAA